MSVYVRNRSCPCPKCRVRGLTGGAILITLGVLFLIQEYWQEGLGRTWPVLLIVVGLLSYASRTASTKGHIQPWWMGETAPNPGQNNPGQTGGDPQVKP